MVARRHQVRQGEARLRARRANGRRRRVPDIYGAHIFQAGLVERPVNLFFVTSTNVRRKRELYIPMDIVNHVDVYLPEWMVLVDPWHREYQLERVDWNGGRICYVGGWRDFCVANHVAERDEIILEFVPQVDGNSILRAVIIRAQ